MKAISIIVEDAECNLRQKDKTNVSLTLTHGEDHGVVAQRKTNVNQSRFNKFKKAAEGAKGYCYFAEDADGNPTVAIAGSNVFTIVSGETILDKREVSVEDAKKFVANERNEYVTQHFNDPIR